MAQDWTTLSGSDKLKNSREPINENFETLRSGWEGTAFPTNPVKGQRCFKSGVWYTCTVGGVSPTWATDDTLHNHDSRYYTESEVDALLGGKAPSSHIHDDRYYTESEMDTLLDAKAAVAHTHDDRYYTETEVDALVGDAGFPSATVMLFGQSTPPTGWTKKTDWANNSMLMFTTGDIASGGSANPASWTTGIAISDHGTHRHTTGSLTLSTAQMPAHKHRETGASNYTTRIAALSGGQCMRYGYSDPWFTPSYMENTGGGSTHNHGWTAYGGSSSHTVTQSTFAPKYQTVIAATKN